jgi:DNA-binding MarR family transcriptional regulator
MSSRPRNPEEWDHIDRFLTDFAKEFPPVDTEVEGIVDRLNSLNRGIRREMEETLADFGLTFGEYKVLGSLYYAGPPYTRTPGELAKWEELSSGAMTNRLDGLEQARLIRRTPDLADRRAVQVELTPKGRSIYEAAFAAQAEKEELVASALTKAEQEELNALLRRMMRAAEKREGDKKAKKAAKTA